MDSSPSGRPSPAEVRIRMAVWQRITPFLPMAVITAVFYAAPGTDISPPGGVPGAVAFWIALLVLGNLLPSRFGITLTPSAAVVRNVRRRTIPWSDIQAVQVQSSAGIKSIVLHEANGRSTELRAPTTGFLSWDRHFQDKLHTIETWWQTHRGPDWTPIPPPPAWWNTPRTRDGDPLVPPK
ncbi:hypothetical protein [Streptomyces sp. NBC_00343]|uniref:hypothetical protein n=1 Tax=Streptomyces sp. NBC_00343 TaxID=2975719 RepID=UPI002E2E2E73|nr:hypothetical protein [Streptomyces sp. NBC_00343]